MKTGNNLGIDLTLMLKPGSHMPLKYLGRPGTPLQHM